LQEYFLLYYAHFLRDKAKNTVSRMRSCKKYKTNKQFLSGVCEVMKAYAKLTAAIACGLFGFASTGLAAPVSLIPNGNFELGNLGFGSDYAFSPLSNTDEGQYTIRANPSPWNPFFITAVDHTSGSGNLLVVNGATIDQRVWYSSAIPVLPNTTHLFGAWIMNACCDPSYGHGTDPVSPAVLSFYANGTLLATGSTDSLGVWEWLSASWNSGGATFVDLELRNSNLAWSGNDFGVDDIYFGSVSEPSTVALVAVCPLLMFLSRRRRTNKAK
jgi:hypothetical protein